MGNNDVNYPYATDEFNNIYLLHAGVIILHNDTIQKKLEKYNDPYNYYYTVHTSTSIAKSNHPPNLVKNSFNIDKFYVNTQKTTQGYQTNLNIMI